MAIDPDSVLPLSPAALIDFRYDGKRHKLKYAPKTHPAREDLRIGVTSANPAFGHTTPMPTAEEAAQMQRDYGTPWRSIGERRRGDPFSMPVPTHKGERETVVFVLREGHKVKVIRRK